MEELCENNQPPRYTVYDALPEKEQSTSIPDKDKFDKNSNVDDGYYEVPQDGMRQPAFIPDRKDIGNNSNVNDGYYEVPQDGIQQPAFVRKDFDNNANVNTTMNNAPILEMQQEAHVPDEKRFDKISNVNAGNSVAFSGVMQQPASISNQKELEENPHVQSNFKVIPSSGETPKLNAQAESTTVLLQFQDLWTLSGIMMIINIVSKCTNIFSGNCFLLCF